MDSEQFVVLRVDVFNNEGGVTVSLSGKPHNYFFAGLDSGRDTLCSYPNVITAGEVRERTRQMLKLKQQSRKIFGLFVGEKGFSTKVLHDADPVPLSGEVLSYQRLSFSLEDDIAVIGEDERALELVFREVKDMFENHKIHPWISTSQRDVLLDLLDHDLLKGPYLNSEKMREFMEVVLSFPKFYSSYYYYVSNCILRTQLVNCMEYDAWYTITADLRQLTVLNIISNKEVASWPWKQVSGMKINETPPRVMVFEVAGVNDEIVSIAFNMDRCRYLFSIILHVLRVLAAKKENLVVMCDEKDNLPNPLSTPQPVEEAGGFTCFYNPMFLNVTGKLHETGPTK